MNNVNRKMVAGIAWMSLMRIGVKGLGLVSTVILARLLAPADFGLVAMAMSVIAALELLRAFNFDIALIQRHKASRPLYDTAWTFNILLGVLLALLLGVIAAPASAFFREPRLQSVIHTLILAVLVSGFENIGVVAFRKDLAFGKEFLFRMAQKLATIAITIPLAFALRSYWALVIGMVSGHVLSVLISYYAHPFRPRLSLKAADQLFSFSKWLLVNNALWFLRDRTPHYVLGRVAGADALGLFTISFEISNLPTTEVIAPINRAVLPAYAKMVQNDVEALRSGFLNVIGLVALLALPAGFGIAATSELIVYVVLGENWLAATPLVSILAVFGALNALQTNCGSVHYAMGAPQTMTMVGTIQVLFLIPALIWGAYTFGAIGIAWAYLANVGAISVPLNFIVVMRRLRLSCRQLLSLFWRPMIASTVMYGAVTFLTIQPSAHTFRTLSSAIGLGGISYGGTLFLLWFLAGRPAGPEMTFTDEFLRRQWNRLAMRAQSNRP